MRCVGGKLKEMWPQEFALASGILYNQEGFDLNQKRKAGFDLNQKRKAGH